MPKGNPNWVRNPRLHKKLRALRVGPYHDRVVQEVIDRGVPWLDNYSAVVRYIILDWARMKAEEPGFKLYTIARLMDIIDNRENK
jgi:hypothetical protein